MSTVIEDKNAYLDNFKYFSRREHGDFTPFYIVIALCTILGFFLFTLNIVLGCCSRYSDYWNDRHTGNRWIISLWTATPHNQPSLDYTELQVIEVAEPRPQVQDYPIPEPEPSQTVSRDIGFAELQKRESEI